MTEKTETLRLFAGIAVPRLKELLRFTNDARQITAITKANWIPTQNWHITLQFIGKANAQQTTLIDKALRECLTNIKPFDIMLQNVDGFPNTKNCKTLYADVAPNDELILLQNIINKKLSDYNIVKANNSYVPHITLARFRDNINIHQLNNQLTENTQQKWGLFTVNDVILYQSILLTTGAVYKPVKTYKLMP